MDLNNSGMNPIVDGGMNKKMTALWIATIVVAIIILGFWIWGGKGAVPSETNTTNEQATTTNQVPKKVPLTPASSTPDINFEAKG